MPRLSTRVPKYRKHASGQAVVRINGHDVYLGLWGSEKSKARYDVEIAAYVADRNGKPIKPQASPLSVTELVVQFWQDRSSDYLRNGAPTEEHGAFRRVLALLRREFGDWPANEFGPLALKALRTQWVNDGLARLSCNRNVRKVVEVWRWGVENQHVQTESWQALKSLRGLRKGKTTAPEPTPVLPVSLVRVQATLCHLSPVLVAMIRLQLLTGARPGEVCRMKPCNVDRSGPVWVYSPSTHKTDYADRHREIYIGPDAQAVLSPYLLRPSASFCFSAAESKEWYRQQASLHRVTPMNCGNARGRKHDRKSGPSVRQPRAYFDSSSYGHAVARACRAAWPAPKSIINDKAAVKAWHDEHRWSPNQLRHTRGTEVRSRYGLEAAQVILGHAKADVTQIYAERDRQLGIRVASESG